MVEGINGSSGVGGVQEPTDPFQDLQQEIKETRYLMKEYRRKGGDHTLLLLISDHVKRLSDIMKYSELKIPNEKQDAFKAMKGFMDEKGLLDDPIGMHLEKFLNDSLDSTVPEGQKDYEILTYFMDDVTGN